MKARVYLSEISPWWTIERQREALAEVIPGAVVFTDLLDRGQKRRHPVTDLPKRAVMLRVSTRTNGATLHIASLATLAWAAEDLVAVLAALKAKHWPLVVGEGGQVSVEAWKAARRQSRLEGAAKRGAAVSAERRRAASDAAIKEHVEPFWHLKTPSKAALAAAAGVSVNTIVARLGTRMRAQFEFEAEEKRPRMRRGKP